MTNRTLHLNQVVLSTVFENDRLTLTRDHSMRELVSLLMGNIKHLSKRLTHKLDLYKGIPLSPNNPRLQLTSVSPKGELFLETLKFINCIRSMEKANKIDPGHLCFLQYMSGDNDDIFVDNIKSWIKNKNEWKFRLDNHFHAFLYTIRKGKRGISKYYSGWDTYVALSNGNIRYLLELVHAAFIRHVENEGNPNQPISAESQTQATIAIAKKNLSELEGLSVEGGKLTKLVLSIGRILQVMASDAHGHSPEVNQFYLKPSTIDSDKSEQVKKILEQAVMHLALVRSTGNKLVSETDTADYDYRLHPIFSSLFVFSYRKKRKFLLSDEQILGLISSPKKIIKEVLSQSNRSDDLNLPDQLNLFGSYYA
ncbi:MULTISPECIES: ORC-CDC6 family AAA ATPase [unclassified Providencia]|uniref:ORC-CDC6 family AAA ATPase n=1 Tax=unclassified Providencia TaxID=2633465 RepID=UPI00234AD782|nr:MULTISPECIES: hypothetical protein [unclassified Providencia]